MHIYNVAKKQICLVLLVVLLLAIYVCLQYFEAKAASAQTVEFNNLVENYEFVIGGEVKGIKLLATGVLVVGIDNDKIPVEVGDIILNVDDKKIESNKELIEYINSKEAQDEVMLNVQRGEKNINISAQRVYSPASKKYELGLWVKDSSAGVGTITFYEKNNLLFAGLGHGISETENNIIIPITSGAIVKSEVKGINKGETNSPGDIRGMLYKEVIGQITKNTQNGIYGILEDDSLVKNKEKIEVVNKNEIKEGKADIYCALDGINVQKYEIVIEKVMLESKSNKNMIIHVTDKMLLEKTGGIIQGMSGCPIVQNGKLIGAVTHVFLNDPTRGYAVFIQNMIEDIQKIQS